MKKLLSLLFLAMALCVYTVGCGGSDTPAPSTPPTSEGGEEAGGEEAGGEEAGGEETPAE